MKKCGSIIQDYKWIYPIFAVISIILIGCLLLIYGLSMIPKGMTLFSFICCAKLGKVLTDTEIGPWFQFPGGAAKEY